MVIGTFRRIKLMQINGPMFYLCRKCSSRFVPSFSTDFITNEHLDENYYLNPKNFDEIHQSIKLRGLTELDNLINDCNSDVESIKKVLKSNLPRLPNKLSPTWKESIEAESRLLDPKVAENCQNLSKKPNFRTKTGEKLLRANKLLMSGSEHTLSQVSSNHCYVLTGDGARFEKALLNWTFDTLVQKFNFIPVIVPNIVYDSVIRACGFEPAGQRTQVYSLKGIKSDPRTVCLSGTSEIPLVALHHGQLFEPQSVHKLPRRLCAVSRCYRAEIPASKAGLYRVHYFNKVEMVSLCKQEESASVLEEFVSIQKYLFDSLGLKYRVRDMPPNDLGLPAFRKIDIEAWFPASKIWGEISSASNCTDFQSRRFNIQYRTFLNPDEDSKDEDGDDGDNNWNLIRDNFVHTVNGTACATPRILLPLIEGNQEENSRIRIPEVLVPRMGGLTYLNKG